jgi:hypothetical protein
MSPRHRGSRPGSSGRSKGTRTSRPAARCSGARSPSRRSTTTRVVAFLSQADVEPDITVEIFFVDGPLPGFGAVEVIEPE